MEVDRHQVVEAAQRLVEEQRYAQALIQYRKLVDADPGDGRALLKMGELHFKLAQYPEAIATFAQVGDVYASQGEPHKALAAYARVRDMVLSHEPSLEAPLRRTALASVELYQQLGLQADALATIGELAMRFEKAHRWPEAVPLRRRAAAIAPDDIGARVKLARALLHVDEIDEAVPLVHSAASQLVEADRFDDALAVLEHLLQRTLDPACARMAAELYLTRDTRPDAVRALSKLQACVRADPRDVDALQLVAHALRRVGHLEQAGHVEREIEAIAAEDGRPTPIYPLDDRDRDVAGLGDLADPADPAARAPVEASLAPRIPQRRPDLIPEHLERADRAPGTDEAIRVIPVSDASWAAIASRLAKATGEPGKDEEIVAFVREGDTARDTMRAIYGVVKFFFA